MAGVIKGEFLKGVTTKKGFLDGEETSPLADDGVLDPSSPADGFFLAVGGV